MAIEPLGNIMSVQAQSIPRVEPEKPADNSMEASQQAVQHVVDTKTATIKKASEADTQEDGKQDDKQPSQEQLRKAVEQINKKANNSEVQFGIHEKTNRVTIKIVDKETKEIIKEL
ncbi:MAG: flagellar protein FlaG, partial [Lachnospiraceae bacterium]|nr:flagellar protein FlaG [Lachnospiraceae bacterium]